MNYVVTDDGIQSSVNKQKVKRTKYFTFTMITAITALVSVVFMNLAGSSVLIENIVFAIGGSVYFALAGMIVAWVFWTLGKLINYGAKTIADRFQYS